MRAPITKSYFVANCQSQVPPERVISVHDVSNIYHVPLLLLRQSELIAALLTLRKITLVLWRDIANPKLKQESPDCL